MKNSYLFAGRNIYLSGGTLEKASSYSESGFWEKYAKEPLVPVDIGKRISFDDTDKRGTL